MRLKFVLCEKKTESHLHAFRESWISRFSWCAKYTVSSKTSTFLFFK